MKRVYRIVTLGILGVALGAPFFIDNKNGEPLLSLPGLSDFKPKSLVPPVPGTGSSSRFYKWQDNQGQWHYSDQPPEPGKKYEVVTVHANTNIIKAIPPDEADTLADSSVSTRSNRGGSVQEPAQGDLSQNTGDILTIENAMNLVEDAHRVKNRMNERNKALESDF
ncbi:MAG: hypothetical protein CSB48_04655 [Proteobacteria bacterium]|nr:MAG: hypothetical protein CSB48_04655 [Pseudomonadota bacterium]